MMFTKIERMVLAVLSDGNIHSLKEIREKVFDEFTESNTIHKHLQHIRHKLPKDETVVSEFKRGFYYRHVRLLPGAKK